MLLATRLIRSPLVDEHPLFGRDDVASLQAFAVEHPLGCDDLWIFRDRHVEFGVFAPLARDLLAPSPCIFDPLPPFLTRQFGLAWWKVIVKRGLWLGLSKTWRRTGQTKGQFTSNDDRLRQRRKPPCVS